MTDWNLKPEDIESKSFEIIEAEAPEHDWAPEAWTIVRRMIHTSADFEYVTGTRIHESAIEAGVKAINGGRAIFTDTRMAQAGISKARLSPFGVKTDCLIDHPDVADQAKKTGTTRAAAAVDLAADRVEGGIYVVGNAPTALFHLLELIKDGRAKPGLVIGLPVGFVNAAESKEALLDCPVPYVTNVGRKGGSNVAAAVVNALADIAAGRLVWTA